MSKNPFSPDYVAQIDMRDVARAAKSSYQQSSVVNRRRAAGVEPTKVNLPNSNDALPQRFVVEMPEMAKYRRTK